MNTVETLIRHGTAGLGLVLPAQAQAQLSAYVQLLLKWNRVYNLTAIRGEQKMVSHHILDSLATIDHLPPGSLLDVGSGAGLPGIPIAIAQPAREVTVLDSNQKKGAFLKQAVAELGLANTQVAVERVETHRPPHAYDVVVSRAFSDLADFVQLAGHLCAPGGVLVAMKGLYPDAEIAQLPPQWKVESAPVLKIPEVDASRHLIVMRAAQRAGVTA
ncbi:MAG TPA: 16S rRNA (guanine(527)-N(7))-methyltransferase RsmG [Burkholderiales bacterium]|nr:16S rRNA (guanine(527)-N(7))-methyltransferase RsmG [Burkholderiales bacterium]